MPQFELTRLPDQAVAAVVLCGGRSRRMGRDKAMLPLGRLTILQHVQRAFRDLSQRSILVIGHDAKPADDVGFDEVVKDEFADFGPLEGMRVGFQAAANSQAILLGTCDAPLVVSELYQLMWERLQQDQTLDAVVPDINGQLYPLTAIYRPTVLSTISEMVQTGELRVKDLFKQINALQIQESEVLTVDPELLTIRNINTREEYQAIRQQFADE